MSEEDTKTPPETPSAEPQPEGPLPPQWEYRRNFKITEKMKNIVNLTMEATQSEIKRLRKRIDKLTYGA